MARYVGLILAPAEGFDRGFFSRQKSVYFAVLAHFRPVLVSSSNLGVLLCHKLSLPNILQIGGNASEGLPRLILPERKEFLDSFSVTESNSQSQIFLVPYVHLLSPRITTF